MKNHIYLAKYRQEFGGVQFGKSNLTVIGTKTALLIRLNLHYVFQISQSQDQWRHRQRKAILEIEIIVAPGPQPR